jgi:hypothetical protein
MSDFLRQPARAADTAERRTLERIPLAGSLELPFIVRPSFQVHWAAVVDFSARGLGLLVDEFVHVGAVLGLRLHLGPEDDQRVLLATVRHCTLYTANAWLLGCVLRQPLDRNSLLAMVNTGDTAISFTL